MTSYKQINYCLRDVVEITSVQKKRIPRERIKRAFCPKRFIKSILGQVEGAWEVRVVRGEVPRGRPNSGSH